MSDTAWRDLARGSRDALAAIGYDIVPQCLPDEPDPCGGNWYQHAAAHLAALQAVINHHWRHLAGHPETAEIFATTYHAVSADLDHH